MPPSLLPLVAPLLVPLPAPVSSPASSVVAGLGLLEPHATAMAIAPQPPKSKTIVFFIGKASS
jgi:hypothetical protein